MAIVRGEKPEEEQAVGDLLRRVYGRDDEALLVASLRKSPEFLPQMSVVAEDNDTLAGYALFLKVAIVAGEAKHPALALVLMAITPEFKSAGVAERLIRTSVERCRGLGLKFIFVVGKPRQFAKFGFEEASGLGLEPEFPLASGSLQVLDMRQGQKAMVKAKVRYPESVRPQ
ncbi:MAG: N-acetyltransferase [Elusimicrobia bacterium]|nr:N-acetyltransferase [Elusimicrobiota bacterium]